MNPGLQRSHRTKTEQLEARITVLETVVDDLARYLSTWAPRIGAQLEAGAVETDAVRLRIEERRSDILAEVGAAIGELRARTLWGRLSWLVTGR